MLRRPAQRILNGVARTFSTAESIAMTQLLNKSLKVFAYTRSVTHFIRFPTHLLTHLLTHTLTQSINHELTSSFHTSLFIFTITHLSWPRRKPILSCIRSSKMKRSGKKSRWFLLPVKISHQKVYLMH